MDGHFELEADAGPDQRGAADAHPGRAGFEHGALPVATGWLAARRLGLAGAQRAVPGGHLDPAEGGHPALALDHAPGRPFEDVHRAVGVRGGFEAAGPDPPRGAGYLRVWGGRWVT